MQIPVQAQPNPMQKTGKGERKSVWVCVWGGVGWGVGMRLAVHVENGAIKSQRGDGGSHSCWAVAVVGLWRAGRKAHL